VEGIGESSSPSPSLWGLGLRIGLLLLLLLLLRLTDLDWDLWDIVKNAPERLEKGLSWAGKWMIGWGCSAVWLGSRMEALACFDRLTYLFLLEVDVSIYIQSQTCSVYASTVVGNVDLWIEWMGWQEGLLGKGFGNPPLLLLFYSVKFAFPLQSKPKFDIQRIIRYWKSRPRSWRKVIQPNSKPTRERKLINSPRKLFVNDSDTWWLRYIKKATSQHKKRNKEKGCNLFKSSSEVVLFTISSEMICNLMNGSYCGREWLCSLRIDLIRMENYLRMDSEFKRRIGGCHKANWRRSWHIWRRFLFIFTSNLIIPSIRKIIISKWVCWEYSISVRGTKGIANGQSIALPRLNKLQHFFKPMNSLYQNFPHTSLITSSPFLFQKIRSNQISFQLTFFINQNRR